MKLGKSICILISGKAGTGKNLVEEILRNDLGFLLDSVRSYSFATPIKEFAKKYFGWSGEKDEKGRKLLQGLGKLGRDYDVDIWARKLFLKVRSENPDFPVDVVLIPDWRFPNELDYSKGMKEYDVITIRIEAPTRESLKGTKEYYDESETSLPTGINEMYDYVIYNDELTLTQLDKCVKEIIRSILDKRNKWE